MGNYNLFKMVNQGNYSLYRKLIIGEDFFEYRSRTDGMNRYYFIQHHDFYTCTPEQYERIMDAMELPIDLKESDFQSYTNEEIDQILRNWRNGLKRRPHIFWDYEDLIKGYERSYV